MIGDYAAWDYFQSLDNPENHAFIRKFKEKYGEDRVTSDVITAAYNSVRLWAQAVSEAQSDEVDNVLKAIRRQSMSAPKGSSRSTSQPCIPGARSTSDGSAPTASSTWSGAPRRPSAPSRSRSRGLVQPGSRS